MNDPESDSVDATPNRDDDRAETLLPAAAEARSTRPGRSSAGVVFPRLLIGWVILICAEVFSGASLAPGLWNSWTLIVTYWLYFAHFFLFTTLAIRTGRTGLSSLYLWGVLFGLYESWITKVIWSGYAADGKFAMGRIGPFGLSEISMVFAFHPIASFLLPLAAACLLCPPLRQWFPDLAWFTGQSGRARATRIYLLAAFGIVMGFNSGGPVNLALNVAFMLVVLLILWRLARPGLAVPDGLPILNFGPWGFRGLCLYLAILYGVTYVLLRPQALPSARVQLLTLGFYAVAIAGLWWHRRRGPLFSAAVVVDPREQKTVVTWFATVLALGFAVSLLPRGPVVVPFALVLVVWPFAGFLLTGIALFTGGRKAPETPSVSSVRGTGPAS